MSNYEVYLYWKKIENLGFGKVVNDCLEPQCWGCNKPIEVETNKDIENKNEKKIWDKTNGKLNKCHIFPKAFGGSEKAPNLFLMCESCHVESPDTMHPDIFFAWVKNKREKSIFGIDIEKKKFELEKYLGLVNIDFVVFLSDWNLLTIENRRKILQKVIDENNAHGVKIADSGIYMNLIHSIYSKDGVNIYRKGGNYETN